MPSRSTAPGRRPPRSSRSSTWRGRSTRSPPCSTRAAALSGGGRPDGPGRPGGGRGLPDPAAAQRRVARPDRRAAAGRGREGAVPGRPARRAGHRLGRGRAGRARPGPLLSPVPPAGWDRAAAWESRTARRRRGGGQAGAGTVGGHHPGPAAAGAAVGAGRAGPPARRRGRLRPGGADLYDPAAAAGELHQTGLDHIAALEARAVELGAEPGAFRAGRGLRRAAGLGREDPAGRGHPRGGGGG